MVSPVFQWYQREEAIKVVLFGHECRLLFKGSAADTRDSIVRDIQKRSTRVVEVAPRFDFDLNAEVILLRPFKAEDLVTLIHPWDAADMLCEASPSQLELVKCSMIADENDFTYNGRRYYITTAVKAKTKAYV